MGSPIVIRYGKRRVTQDLCHSVEELRSIRVGLGPNAPLQNIAEIGAGHGRLAYLFKRSLPGSRYHVVDIPPALYLSQRYLTEVLPGVRTFRFRPFRTYDEVREEMEAAQLVFLEPHQLELFPADHFDLVITVSTLDEMRHDQIANFLQVVDRVCRGAFYTKQWRWWRNPTDLIEVSKADYPIPAGWTPLFDRSPLVPRRFFETLYRTR